MQITCIQEEFVKTLKYLKYLDEYYDLYLKKDTLHVADVLENFRKYV